MGYNTPVYESKGLHFPPPLNNSALEARNIIPTPEDSRVINKAERSLPQHEPSNHIARSKEAENGEPQLQKKRGETTKSGTRAVGHKPAGFGRVSSPPEGLHPSALWLCCTVQHAATFPPFTERNQIMKKILTSMMAVMMAVAMSVGAVAQNPILVVGGTRINSLQIVDGTNENGVFSGKLTMVWNNDNGNQSPISWTEEGVEVVWGVYSRIGNNATYAFTVAQQCTEQTLQFSTPGNGNGTNYSNTVTIPLAHTPGAAATCEDDQICTVCDKVLVDAFGHN
jgi:hypothetical protein